MSSCRRWWSFTWRVTFRRALSGPKPGGAVLGCTGACTLMRCFLSHDPFAPTPALPSPALLEAQGQESLSVPALCRGADVGGPPAGRQVAPRPALGLCHGQSAWQFPPAARGSHSRFSRLTPRSARSSQLLNSPSFRDRSGHVPQGRELGFEVLVNVLNLVAPCSANRPTVTQGRPATWLGMEEMGGHTTSGWRRMKGRVGAEGPSSSPDTFRDRKASGFYLDHRQEEGAPPDRLQRAPESTDFLSQTGPGSVLQTLPCGEPLRQISISAPQHPHCCPPPPPPPTRFDSLCNRNPSCRSSILLVTGIKGGHHTARANSRSF